jgi:hypothetical protein
MYCRCRVSHVGIVLVNDSENVEQHTLFDLVIFHPGSRFGKGVNKKIQRRRTKAVEIDY